MLNRNEHNILHSSAIALTNFLIINWETKNNNLKYYVFSLLLNEHSNLTEDN